MTSNKTYRAMGERELERLFLSTREETARDKIAAELRRRSLEEIDRKMLAGERREFNGRRSSRRLRDGEIVVILLIIGFLLLAVVTVVVG